MKQHMFFKESWSYCSTCQQMEKCDACGLCHSCQDIPLPCRGFQGQYLLAWVVSWFVCWCRSPRTSLGPLCVQMAEDDHAPLCLWHRLVFPLWVCLCSIQAILVLFVFEGCQHRKEGNDDGHPVS